MRKRVIKELEKRLLVLFMITALLVSNMGGAFAPLSVYGETQSQNVDQGVAIYFTTETDSLKVGQQGSFTLHAQVSSPTITSAVVGKIQLPQGAEKYIVGFSYQKTEGEGKDKLIPITDFIDVEDLFNKLTEYNEKLERGKFGSHKRV